MNSIPIVPQTVNEPVLPYAPGSPKACTAVTENRVHLREAWRGYFGT